MSLAFGWIVVIGQLHLNSDVKKEFLGVKIRCDSPDYSNVFLTPAVYTLKMAKNPSGTYHSYILRIWCEDSGDTKTWRTSLEDLGSEKRYGFASLQSLNQFLEAMTAIDFEPGTKNDVPENRSHEEEE